MNDDTLHAEFLRKQSGTDYPYADVTGNWANKFRKLLAPVNPLAIEQSTVKPRLNAVPFHGPHFDQTEPLPNPVKYNAFGVAHYDHRQDTDAASKESIYFGNSFTKEDNTVMELTPVTYPRVCHRYGDIFRRCEAINGRNKCSDEAVRFLSVCPNFALDDLRKAKLFHQKAKLIQRQEYFDAMKVSSYNKDRSVADVDIKKDYRSGIAPNLRSDSMWIDDRYADVTQEDINAAKARVAARQAARAQHEQAHGHNNHHDHHDGHGHHQKKEDPVKTVQGLIDLFNVDYQVRKQKNMPADLGKQTHNTASNLADQLSDRETKI